MNESITDNLSGKITPVPKDFNLSIMSSLTTDSTLFYSPYSSRDNTKCIEEQESEPTINTGSITDDAKTFYPLRRPDSLADRVKGRPPIRSSSESLATIEDDNEKEESVHTMDKMETSNISTNEEKEQQLPVFEVSEATVTVEEQDMDEDAREIEEEYQIEETVEVSEESVTFKKQGDKVEPNIVETDLPVIHEERSVIVEEQENQIFKEPTSTIAPVSINKINTTTFAPFVSSSKFGELDRPDSTRPMSDKSTVIGSSTMFFQESFSSSTVSSKTSKTTYYTALESTHGMDTTVGMTGFECTQLGIPREILDCHEEESYEPEKLDEEEDEMDDFFNDIDGEEDHDKSSSPEVVCLDSSSESGHKVDMHGGLEQDNGMLLLRLSLI